MRGVHYAGVNEKCAVSCEWAVTESHREGNVKK